MATRMLGWPRFYTLTKRNFEYSALGTDRLAVEGQSSPPSPRGREGPGEYQPQRERFASSSQALPCSPAGHADRQLIHIIWQKFKQNFNFSDAQPCHSVDFSVIICI